MEEVDRYKVCAELMWLRYVLKRMLHQIGKYSGDTKSLWNTGKRSLTKAVPNDYERQYDASERTFEHRLTDRVSVYRHCY